MTHHTVTFVFIYGSLRLGGIETLIVRLSNYLVANGFRVILFSTGGELSQMLTSGVELQIYSDTANLREKAMALIANIATSEEVLILSFDPISAARALLVEVLAYSRRRCSHFTGVYHPRAYFMDGERKDRLTLNRIVARAVGYENILFMNRECRDGHAKSWRRDLSMSPVLALPINARAPSWRPTSGAKLRIASVGRLVDFKAYNLGAPKIIRKLISSGVDAVWDIYGEGPQREAIESEIAAYEVGGFVRILGEVPYDKMHSSISNYDVFVGMGTAALEAAMAGLPVICAADGIRELCYGYLSDLPFGNVGELQCDPPVVDIACLLTSYANFTWEQRSLMSNRCHAAARQYETAPFIGKLLSLHCSRRKAPTRAVKEITGMAYWAATDSSLVRTLRDAFRR